MKIIKILKKNKIEETFFILVVGSLIFKFLPMYIWGKDILFDASNHIMATSFGLYLIYLFFIKKNKRIHLIYFIFSGISLILIGSQRIYAHQHNLFGLILGVSISAISIWYPRKKLKGKIKRK